MQTRLKIRHPNENATATEYATDADKSRAREAAALAKPVAEQFGMRFALERIESLERHLTHPLTLYDFLAEIRVLREALEAGLNGKIAFLYSDDHARVVMAWKAEWATVLEKFPAAEVDIRSAVDCWALGHGTAAVFHLMRVLEYGLAALAGDVGIAIETQNWQNVIDQIESKVRSIGKELPGGLEKSDRLRFLSESAKEMVYFKDGWRNHVSHNRAIYDEFQARSVLEHVRTFMTTLSARLSEVPLP